MKTMLTTIEDEMVVAVGSGISATAVAFMQSAVLRMIPYAVPALVIIALDLLYGIKAAKHRKERVRFSTACRRTVSKIVSYICWLILCFVVFRCVIAHFFKRCKCFVLFALRYLIRGNQPIIPREANMIKHQVIPVYHLIKTIGNRKHFNFSIPCGRIIGKIILQRIV